MQDQFWERGYCVIEGLLDQSKIDLVRASLDHTIANREMRERNSGYVHGARDEYSPAVGELLLRHCQPAFENALGRSLQESFAYWRVYEKGGVLKRHMDRIGCEISATVTIARDPVDAQWPIKITDMQSNEVSVELKPGSALLYQGHQIPHWRDPFEGNSAMQLLFHYVLKDGEYADRKFDGRGVDPVERYYEEG